MMHSGEQTRTLSREAGTMLGRHTRLVMRQTRDGYELSCDGEMEPVACNNWPQARRVLVRLGVPSHRINEISSLLSEETEIVVRRKI